MTDQDGQNCEGCDEQKDGQIWGMNKNGKKTNVEKKKGPEEVRICIAV